MKNVKLFEFLLPARWRQRAPMDGELNDQVLSQVTDTHPVYRAVMDHAHELLEGASEGALQPNLSDQQRQFQSGRAFGLMEFIGHVENIRARARQVAEAQAERARQKCQKLDRELKCRGQG